MPVDARATTRRRRRRSCRAATPSKRCVDHAEPSAGAELLNLASWRRLKRLLDDLAGESGLRAVVLRGAGDKAFAAGADIKEFPNTRMSAADAAEYNESLAVCLRALTTMPIPVIAAVRGLAVGGGCELATACDVCIATDDARFGIPLGKLGVTTGFTEADTVARLIGPAALKYLLFSGELIGIEEAARW
ncbi:enoyl-CoA hydratase echA18 [Mycobacterium tuberculosis GM 1503]|nr:enoyl-CoA hydratase echA18 [Mycobacterium tuberculosis GM 1503]